jgi:hypothetical protein
MGPWQRGRKDDGDAAGQEGGEGEQRVPGRVSQREDTDAERADAEERGGISTALRRSARSTNQLAGAASPLSASVGFSVLPGSRASTAGTFGFCATPWRRGTLETPSERSRDAIDREEHGRGDR